MSNKPMELLRNNEYMPTLAAVTKIPTKKVEEMDKATVIRAALGQVAALGDLYDAKTDTFCGTSLFKKRIPDGALSIFDKPSSEFYLMQNDIFSKKSLMLEVNAELQVSILVGLSKLRGSGLYLNDQKSSARTIKSSLLYNIKTKHENVNLYHEELRNAFDINAIDSGVATHVVVGISWGANTVLSCEYYNIYNKDTKEQERNLAALMNKLSLSISGEVSMEFDEIDQNKSTQFDIRIFGDIFPQDQNLPTTFSGAEKLMKRIPNLIAFVNQGRGKPLTYRLIPLSLLKYHLNVSIKANSIISSVEEASLFRIVQIFEQSSHLLEQINDLNQDAVTYKVCLTQESIAKIIKLAKDFVFQETKFRYKLATTLSSVRSGKSGSSALEDLIALCKTGVSSFEKQLTQLTAWENVAERLLLAKTLIDAGATYIGFDSSLDSEILRDFQCKTFVLYFKHEAKTTQTETWKHNLELFLNKVKKEGACKYFAVDCDIQSKLWPKVGISIQVVQNGRVLTEDLVADEQNTEKFPLAKNTLGIMEPTWSKPKLRATLRIPCTGKSCTPNVEYTWTCGKCGHHIEFGFDSYFYCACGKSLANFYEFRCLDRLHGVNYEQHDEYIFKLLLNKLRPFKEMNILILGETGVGKSTWINGFTNFLNFESLQEAEKNELCSLIPSEFTVCDKDYNEILVSTGNDTNEVQTAGQSATQESKVYPFEFEDMKIRLIDTPGIGDTRGIDQDKKNFQNILTTLSHLEELHGICILLKPNNARLTVMFRFCIKELLTYLHKDASRNIMFCFTNCRGTFYRPGDTMPALKNLLAENKDVEIPISCHTIYCYDSEAYRFLAAVKNKNHPVKFPDDERENFSKSWETSIKETKRMLKHISDLKPHPIQSTLNLNHARELVVKLTRPLAEITKNIQTNRAVIKDYMEEIKNTEENIKLLRKRKMRFATQLKITKVDYPKTVCANLNCCKIYGPDNMKSYKYTTICHEKCGLGGTVSADTKGHSGLLRCSAMANGICKICFHPYQDHLHCYYDSEEVTVPVENEEVKNLLKQKASAADVKRQMIKNCEKDIAEYDCELKEIEKASVKFACFLKHNAITPYNDAMLEYMDHLIREEDSKIKLGGTTKTLESLKEGRESYQMEIEILEKEMTKGDACNALNPAEVESLVKHLYGLKHNGNALKEALSAVKSACQQGALYREVVSTYRTPIKKNYAIYNIGRFITSFFQR